MKQDDLKGSIEAQIKRLQKLLEKLDEDGSNNIGAFLYLKQYKFLNETQSLLLDELIQINQKLSIRTSNNIYCRFADNPEYRIAQFLLASGEKNLGLNEIEDFTENASDLIIIDPYFYAVNDFDSDTYVENFIKSTGVKNENLKKIHIVFKKKAVESIVKSKIEKICKDNQCELSEATTNNIHDRIWIKNKQSAIVVGTSFNTLGKSLCFILKLPDEDLINLFNYLQESDLLNN